MKYFFAVLLSVPVFLAGCVTQQHYIVLLTNGRQVVAAQKPHLEGFDFVFLDLMGRTNSVPSGYIRAVTPDTGRSTSSPPR
jgi:hypothetical protein